MIIGLFAVGLFFLILIIAGTIGGSSYIFDALTFNFDGRYAFVLPLMVLSYFGILIGILGLPIYISGLNLFTLARIAVNTEKDA